CLPFLAFSIPPLSALPFLSLHDPLPTSRSGGVTGFMDAAALADAHPLPLSAHCGPTVHMHLACAARPLRHVEYFHDHVRIEQMRSEEHTCEPQKPYDHV